MAVWSTNNLASVNLWSTLYIMKQHKKTFKNAEALKMQDLLFFNPTLSDDQLKHEAEGIADFLNEVFRKTYNAKFEQNIDKSKATAAMVAILVQKNKSLPDLAQTIDDNYNF